MTEVELLKTFRISPDGLRVETWPKGARKVVNDRVLAIMIECGVAQLVEHAPENKALGPAPKRKRGRPRKVANDV